MTREKIENFREVILPFNRRVLLKIDYEGQGASDAEEFAKDFNEILNLAIKALEQEPITKNDCAEQNGCITCSLDDGDDCCRKLYEESMQEPTKNDLGVDCISREDVLMCLTGEFENREYELSELIKIFSKRIKALPSVTPQEPRWIPVSEKLPNDREWYLGIFKEPDTGWINPLPFICDYVGRETKATTKEYWILRGFTDMDEHIDYYFNLECVAWMPLPKAYGEVEE